jgi:hypothetical protein
MQIAPGVSTEQWAALESVLDDPQSPRWQEAVEILRKRIDERFMNPVRLMLADDAPKDWKDRRHGFAIVAIDCLLIETFESFIEGEPDPRNMAGLMFVAFLTTRPSFAAHFDATKARQFYLDFRCGILHQAEIKGESRVWSEGPMIRMSGNGMIINRTLFHEAIEKELAKYLADLGNPAEVVLRNNFRKKMKFIARMAP